MLYHFSEDPNITTFVPRKGRLADMPPIVWAIDQEHACHYYFPRNCPRIIYAKSPQMSKEDERCFFGHTLARKVITVESSWYERLHQTTIYKYTFHDWYFEQYDKTAGYYISRREAKPVSVEAIDHLPRRIMALDIELRFTPSLISLQSALLSSTISQFSMIRLRNMIDPNIVDL